MMTPLEGLVTPSGLTSIPAGLETPEMIQLRKKKIEESMEKGLAFGFPICEGETVFACGREFSLVFELFCFLLLRNEVERLLFSILSCRRRLWPWVAL